MAARRGWRMAFRVAMAPVRGPLVTRDHNNCSLAAPRGVGILQDPPLLNSIPRRGYAKFSRGDDDDDNYQDPSTRPDPQKGPRMNRAITDRFIRVVSDEGHRVITREEALEMAQKQGLDLVEVDPNNNPIVCKIMDYKKEKYKDKLREKERKKTNVDSRRLSEMKELQISTKIEERDLEMKAENASRLIQRGHRLKCVVKMQVKQPKGDDEDKGEIRVDPKAPQLIDKLILLLKDVAKLEQGPHIERHRVWAMFRPIPTVTKQTGSAKGTQKPA